MRRLPAWSLRLDARRGPGVRDAIEEELGWLETSGTDIEAVTHLVAAFDDLLVEAFELEVRLERRFG